MNHAEHERIFGVETEFGTLVSGDLFTRSEEAVELVKDCVFEQLRLGAIDVVARDEVFEPTRSGGFLINGARLYIDAVGSHLEYATAECRSLKDLIANDRAGQQIIVRAIDKLGLADSIDVYNNSVDHFGGHTFGCHENYLVQADDSLLNEKVHLFFPFLTTRQIFAGVGRVGGHILTADGALPTHREIQENPIDYIWVSHVYNVIPDPDVEFQLSQRADHIIKTVASRVRFNRAMINPKWEHFYSHEGMTRLHLLFGESNQNEYAYALKVGTTTLVIRLLEMGLVPSHLMLAHPLYTLRDVSRDQTYKWLVYLSDGSTVPAVDLQRAYLEIALQAFKGESEQSDWILREWEATLDGLEKDPMSMGDRIDWVAKKQIVDQYRAAEGLSWQDSALHSIDLEYHNIDPAKSLYHGYREAEGGRRLASDLDIVTAQTDPPQDTRAKARGQLVERILAKKRGRNYAFDWNGVMLGPHQYVDLSDPFNPEIPEDLPN